jgi:hypothetical protein
MTIPSERTRAVINTHRFLLGLLSPKETPRVPKKIRKMAARLLRHYPSGTDLYLASKSVGSVFGKPEQD